MKKLILIALANLYFLTVTHSQINYIYNKLDNIDSLSYDSGLKNIYWNDGILSMGFSATYPVGNYGLTLSFYDTLGNMNWKKNIYLPTYENVSGQAILASNNAGFYVYGTIYKASFENEYDNFLAKFDANGDTIYFKIFSDSISNVGEDMAWYGDTLLLLSDQKNTYTDLYAKILIRKSDTNGIIHSSYLSAAALKYPENILYDPTLNCIYVGGTRRTTASSSYNVKVFVHRYPVNFTSTTTWNPSLTLNEYFHGFTLWNNRVYVVSNVTGATWYKGRVGQLYPLGGGYLFFEDIGPEMFNGGIFGPVVVNNKYLAIAATYGNGFLDNHIYFADSALNLLCETTVGLNDTIAGQALGYLNVLPGERIMSSGLAFDDFDTYPRQDHWNFMTQNITQFLIDECAVGISEQPLNEINISIYPNPSAGRFNFYSPYKSIREILVFNIKGEMVHAEKEINQRLFFIDKNFQSGIYSTKVILENGQTQSCKLIVIK